MVLQTNKEKRKTLRIITVYVIFIAGLFFASCILLYNSVPKRDPYEITAGIICFAIAVLFTWIFVILIRDQKNTN
jgi:hypothetical protein